LTCVVPAAKLRRARLAHTAEESMSTVATPADTQQLVLRRVFDAPPRTVFHVWSDPSRVKEWWHPKDFTTPSFEMDFRQGGAYRHCIRSAKHQVWAHGVYHEIDPPSRLVMSFQWESGDATRDQPTLITVIFEAEGEGNRTLLTFRQEPFASEAERQSHVVGWGQVLDPSPRCSRERVRDPLSAFRWVPPFAQGLVRDLRVRWALEEAGLPYEVMLNRPRGPEVRPLPQDAALRSGAGDR
jgi:uncharacterized protein YndB with AHSA1/START domain